MRLDRGIYRQNRMAGLGPLSTHRRVSRKQVSPSTLLPSLKERRLKAERLVAEYLNENTSNEQYRLSQELLWAASHVGNTQLCAEVEYEIARTLSYGNVIDIQESDTGSGGVSFLTFENGLRGVYTPDVGWPASYQNEIALYIIDRLFGFDLVPVTVLRDFEGDAGFEDALLTAQGSVQLFVEQAALAKDVQSDQISKASKVKMNILDMLANSGDRHNKNALVMENGDLVAIDNSIAFQLNGSWLPESITRADLEQPGIKEQLERLASVDVGMIRSALSPWVDSAEIDKLLERRDRILQFAFESEEELLEHKGCGRHTWEL